MEGLFVIILAGGVLALINWCIDLINPKGKQWRCDNKVDYDPEHDTWFKGCSWHECSLCKKKEG